MEETIGYEALFSAEEWDAIGSGEWSGPDDWGSPKEEEPVKHSVSVEVVDDGYELSCDACDFYDHVSDVTEADALKRLHEAFIATLVEKWTVTI